MDHGSFTGIRIGVASCKAMAEVINKKIVAVISLDSLATNAINNSATICSLIDARNNQVYCGIYDSKINKLEDYQANDINVVIQSLSKYDDITFVGDGAILHHDLICDYLKNKSIQFCENNKQNVDSLGIIVNKKAQNGELLSCDEVVPVYLRKSQAERNK